MSIRAIYIYTDDRGRPIFRKVRREPKAFHVEAARFANDRMYWKSGPQVVERYQPEWKDRALYNLPVLTDALRRNDDVLIVEGERDVDTLTAMLKLPATTSWQGAKGFTDEQAEWFVRGNSTVNLIIDNDDAGYWGGWLRYQRLRGAGVRMKRLRVWRARGNAVDITQRLRGKGASRSALTSVNLGDLEKRANSEAARTAASGYLRRSG